MRTENSYTDPEESKRRRALNRESSAKLLRDSGVPFLSSNNGAHLIVGQPPMFDFWPGTGKWIARGGSKKGRGVFNMLRVMGVKANTGGERAN